ncbi:hypothetical protein QJS10_CPA10g01247 [Acorus calamus]|uniref:Uncharacterized protein n=1 Tax=Acorus calamus TaxID=4465 RepID=A0AAV9E016_ACOCL|nr:hypothetical protein QJS10_CPA10g01247 [Acorus calamus]
MASMKAEKPQGNPQAASGQPKIQQAKAGAAKPAVKKVEQKPREPKKVFFSSMGRKGLKGAGCEDNY